MWCPEGYVTLDEIISEFAWSTHLVQPAADRPKEAQEGPQTLRAGLDQTEVSAFTNWMLAVFVSEFGEHLRVCLTSGQLVRVVPQAFEWYSPFGYSDYDTFLDGFPAAYSDRVRLSRWRFPFLGGQGGGSIRVNQKAPEDSFAALAGLPVCIADAVLPVSLEGFAGWLIGEVPRMARAKAEGLPPSWSSKDVAQQIVDAYHSGVVKTKSEAQRRFGRGLVTDAWLALFQEAALIDPNISKPGRKKGQKSKS